VKHVLRILQQIADELDGTDPSTWPKANKILWRINEAARKDVTEKNTPATYFRERLSEIQHAVNLQTMDSTLWEEDHDTRYIYLQKSLKDLHRVVEMDQPEEAISDIRGRLDT